MNGRFCRVIFLSIFVFAFFTLQAEAGWLSGKKSTKENFSRDSQHYYITMEDLDYIGQVVEKNIEKNGKPLRSITVPSGVVVEYNYKKTHTGYCASGKETYDLEASTAKILAIVEDGEILFTIP